MKAKTTHIILHIIDFTTKTSIQSDIQPGSVLSDFITLDQRMWIKGTGWNGFSKLERKWFNIGHGRPGGGAVTFLSAWSPSASTQDPVRKTGKKNTQQHYWRKELNVLTTPPLPDRFGNCTSIPRKKHFLLLPLEIWKFKTEKNRTCRMLQSILG